MDAKRPNFSEDRGSCSMAMPIFPSSLTAICLVKVSDVAVMTVKAVLNYQLLLKPVAELLKVPDEESDILVVNEHSTEIRIYD